MAKGPTDPAPTSDAEPGPGDVWRRARPLLANLLAPLGAPFLPVPLRRALCPGAELDPAGWIARRHPGDLSIDVARAFRGAVSLSEAQRSLLDCVVAPVVGRAGLRRVAPGPTALELVVARRDGSHVRVLHVPERDLDGPSVDPPDLDDTESSDASDTVAVREVQDEAALQTAREALAAALGIAALSPDAARAWGAPPPSVLLRDLDIVFVPAFAAAQRGLLDEDAQEVLGRWACAASPPTAPLRVRVARGHGGAVAAALIDGLACAALAARLAGASVTGLRVEICLDDADDDELAWLGRLLGAEPAGPLLRGRYGGLQVTLAGPSLPGEAWRWRPLHDLILLADDPAYPLADDEPSAALHQLRANGRVVWLPEPDRAGASRAPSGVDLPMGEWLSAPQRSDVEFALLRWWGHDAFRPGQWPIVERALTGRPVLGILPTGAGKTVCFQLPALLLGGTTVVCSPLQSLIDDQVHNLDARGLRGAVALHANRSPRDLRRGLDQIRRGRCRLVYLSPERFQSRAFCRDLAAAFARGNTRPRLLVLDEAHLASEWGHDFRPAYLNLPDVHRTLFPSTPAMLLTATASAWIRRDLVQLLDLPSDATILPDDFDRPELAFAVREVADDAALEQAVEPLLRHELPSMLGHASHEALHAAEARRFAEGGLVFTPYTGARARRRPLLTTEGVADHLRERGLHADRFHGGLPREERARAQHVFTDNRAPILVATKGFGTGIDKPNVRWVVHMGYAGSLEAYYQEAGRAGRDRNDARAVALWQPRAPACQPELRAPECVASGRCPHGLERPCSFGVQASLRGGNLRGADLDTQVASEVWRRLRASADAGGHAPIARSLRLVVRPTEPSDRAAGGGDVELDSAGEAPPDSASQDGSTHDTARSVDVSGAGVEHALLRLRALGLVGRYWYGRRPDEWLVDDVRPLDEIVPDELGVRLARTLDRVLEPDAARAQTAEWSGASHADAEARVTDALSRTIGAWYETVAAQSWQMLENMEEFASSTDCRRNRITTYMNERAEPVPTPCGRCDNCGIRPLAEVRAARRVQRDARRLEARERALAAAHDEVDAEEILRSVDAVAPDDLGALRGALQRTLEQRPRHVGARMALARVRSRDADDRVRACREVELALHELVHTGRWDQAAVWADRVHELDAWPAVRRALAALPASAPDGAARRRLERTTAARCDASHEAFASLSGEMRALTLELSTELDRLLEASRTMSPSPPAENP